MRKSMLIACGLAASLVLPAGASAVKPVDRVNAAKECRAERGTDDATIEAFRTKYGTNEDGSNAFGKCVSRRAREEAAERRAAKRAAKEACTDAGKTGRALGHCIGAKSARIQRAEDAEDRQEIGAFKNAAKACDAERGETPESQAAFAEKYGTNPNNKNAFGKCVSALAKQLNEDNEES